MSKEYIYGDVDDGSWFSVLLLLIVLGVALLLLSWSPPKQETPCSAYRDSRLVNVPLRCLPTHPEETIKK